MSGGKSESLLPPSPLTAIAAEGTETTSCCETIPLPPFDEEAAKGLSPDEVRARWPRRHSTCNHCGSAVILYASFAHFLAGDW